MKRRPPPPELTSAFYEKGYAVHGRRCWLRQFDEHNKSCSERFEVIHLIGRMRIREILRPQLMDLPRGLPIDELTRSDVDDLVELCEWDIRNVGGLGCEGHHRRFDNALTPPLRVPAEVLVPEQIAFIDDWGFEIEAMRRFDDFDTAVLAAGDRPVSAGTASVGGEQGGGEMAA